MKKILLSVFAICTVFTVNAELLLNESFNYPLGNLEGNGAVIEGRGGWNVTNKSSDANGTSPQIVAGNLTFSGYPGVSPTTVAKLDPAIGDDNSNARITTKFIVKASGDSAKYSEYEKIYVAALVNVSSEGSKLNSERDILTFEGSLTSSMTRGRIFARINSSNQVYFSVGKNGTSNSGKSDFVDCDKTHLLVFVYNNVEGDSNDVIQLYVNPDPTKAESLQTAALVNGDTQSDYSTSNAIAINLRQRNINTLVGGLRVGTTWEDVVMNNSTSVESSVADNGNIVSTKYYNLSGVEVSEPVNANGIYIKKDIFENGAVSTSKVIK